MVKIFLIEDVGGLFVFLVIVAASSCKVQTNWYRKLRTRFKYTFCVYLKFNAFGNKLEARYDIRLSVGMGHYRQEPSQSQTGNLLIIFLFFFL